LVLLFAWETLLPTIGFFPVTWQTFAMTHSFIAKNKDCIRHLAIEASGLFEFE